MCLLRVVASFDFEMLVKNDLYTFLWHMTRVETPVVPTTPLLRSVIWILYVVLIWTLTPAWRHKPTDEFPPRRHMICVTYLRPATLSDKFSFLDMTEIKTHQRERCGELSMNIFDNLLLRPDSSIIYCLWESLLELRSHALYLKPPQKKIKNNWRR